MINEERKHSRSISQLKAYTKCGEAFYLERFKRKELPKFPAAWTLSGSAFHEALVPWEESERGFDLAERFNEVYDKLVEEAKLEQPDLEQWMRPPQTKSTESDIENYRRRFLTKDIPNYVARRNEAEWEVFKIDGKMALELEFELQLGEVLIRGAIDLVQWWPKQEYVTVEDTKTGSPDNHEKDQRQLGLYALALEELFGINPMYGRYWFTKVDRGSQWFDLSRYTREYFIEEFRKLDFGIQNQIFIPNPGKACGLCAVKPWCREKGWRELPQREEKVENV